MLAIILAVAFLAPPLLVVVLAASEEAAWRRFKDETGIE